jgi:hypothetical protein
VKDEEDISLERTLALVIRDAADRAAAKIMGAIVEKAIAEFSAAFDDSPKPEPFVPKLSPQFFKSDPKNGLCRPVAGWEERCRRAVAEFEPDVNKRYEAARPFLIAIGKRY